MNQAQKFQKIGFTAGLVTSIATVLYPLTLYAHPVSYEGGTMAMGTYSKDWIEHDLNYTFSPNSSFGISNFWIDDGKSSRDYIIPRFSRRFRKNGMDYQANLYLTAGLGARYDNSSPVGYLNTQADYETRRIYTLGLAETIVDGDDEPRTHFQYRLGFAPYKTDFDGVSTWIIGQIDYRPFREDESVVITPVLRFFYHNILIELGADLDGGISGSWMLNF